MAALVTTHRARLAALVLAATLLGAACVPPPAPGGGSGGQPPTCLPADPVQPADYQRAFDTRGPEWAGGDAGQPVPLPDGRVLWPLGDTYVGRLSASGGLAPGWRMVPNSLVVQSGRCFEHVLGGRFGAREPAIPAPAAGEWLWPTSGFVHDGVVHLFALRLARAPGLPGWDWRIVGTSVATLSLPSLEVVSVTASPADAPDPAPQFGSSLVETPDHVYLYAVRGDGHYVARASRAHAVSGPWEFWDGTAWTADQAAAAPMTFDDAPPRGGLTVIAHDGGWLASAKRWDVVSDDVSAWWSSSPTGPWAPRGRVATTTVEPGSRQFTYGGRVLDLPGSGLTVVYNVNTDVTELERDARIYGPHFASPVFG